MAFDVLQLPFLQYSLFPSEVSSFIDINCNSFVTGIQCPQISLTYLSLVASCPTVIVTSGALPCSGFSSSQTVLLLCYLPDSRTPWTINGWEFREAQLADPYLADVPVIPMTDATNPEEQVQSLKAVGFVAKPSSFSALLNKVERYC